MEPRFGLAHLCELALEKDRGFLPDVLRGMLDKFERLPRDEFDVDDTTFSAITDAVARWHAALGGDPRT